VKASYSLLSFPVAMVLSCASFATGQMIKAAVVSTTLETTSFAQWSQDLGYQKTQLYPLILAATGCPLVDVDASGVKVSLLLDSGTARGLVITNNAPPIPYRVEERMEELNADGSHRGESFRIRVETVSVLGEVFKNVAGSLSDWQMFASEPFNGTVGLDFFLDRRLTLDYQSRKVGVTCSPLPERLDRKRYLSLALTEPPKSQGHILYERARVNGREAIVYFDTGYNVSFIDPGFAEGLARVERPGKFKLFREGVPLELGGHTFVLDELRESPVRRGTGFDLPVALVLGSALCPASSSLSTSAPRSSSSPSPRSSSLFQTRIPLACRAVLCKYDFMRTTVDLPDFLFRQVKSVAASRGSTLKDFVQNALQQAVTSGRGARRRKVRLPLIRSKHPGALRLTNADIEDHLARH